MQDLLRAAIGHKPKAVDQTTTTDEGTGDAKKGNGNFVLQDTEYDPDDFFDDSWMDKKGAKGGSEEKSKEGEDDEEDEEEVVTEKKEESEEIEKKEEEKENVALSRDEVQVSTVDAFQGAEKGRLLYLSSFSSPCPSILLPLPSSCVCTNFHRRDHYTHVLANGPAWVQ